MEGTIKHYSGKKGYGFITSEQQDYFFLQTDFIAKPNGFCKVGNKVIFSPMNSSKGLRATQIQKI